MLKTSVWTEAKWIFVCVGLFGVLSVTGYRLSNQNLGGRNVGPRVYNSIFIIVDCYCSTVSKDCLLYTSDAADE